MFNTRAFDLLAGLETDNSKEWFDAHREDVRTFVQTPFSGVLETVTEKLADSSMPLKGSEKTMYRMNRDVRFSKDKSPYNAHVSGVLTKSGSKSDSTGLTYLHMDARGGFIASGFYGLAPKELGPIRDRIVDRANEFEDALQALKDAGYQLSEDDTLTAMPQGFAQHSEAEYARYLKLKSLIVRSETAKSAWTSGDVVEATVKLTNACAGLIKFGRAARGG